jgi:hypothetical protein
MLTSAECRVMATQTLVKAGEEPQRRTRLLIAHQAWLILENELRQSEAMAVELPALKAQRCGAR